MFFCTLFPVFVFRESSDTANTYSVHVLLLHDMFYELYESRYHEEILFARFGLDWLCLGNRK